VIENGTIWCGYERPWPFPRRTFTAVARNITLALRLQGHFPGLMGWWPHQHVGKPVFADMGTKSVEGFMHPAGELSGSTYDPADSNEIGADAGHLRRSAPLKAPRQEWDGGCWGGRRLLNACPSGYSTR